MRPLDVVVVGELNADLIVRLDAAPEFGQVEKLVADAGLTVGSSSAIFACGAARLGLRVGFIGKVGADEFGRFMLDSLAQRGVETARCVIDSQIRTGLSVILSMGNDRAILTYPGSIPALRFGEIDLDYMQTARHLHLGSYFLLTGLHPHIPALFDLAHQAKMTVSLDTNYDPHEAWDSGVRRALERADVFLPNEVESRAISGASGLDQALDRLSSKVKTVVVKLGAQGAAARQGQNVARVPALPVDLVDTVGAGDSFDAGFIYGHLAGWDLERSLRLGVICGSLSTTRAGGVQAQPTLEEALGYVDTPI